jgi:UDP-N-acetylmuramoyl-tripeptide--D-alanyl-D-alanine ligase
MNIEALYNIYCQFPSVKTDTRKIQSGDIYIALKGPNFNGNAFALKAIEAGAAYAIVDETLFNYHPQIILVNDSLETLQALALYHRQQFTIPFLAITGSNGKTTTKELIHEVLSTTFKTSTTVGNLNNHIGIPLTILSIPKDAEMAVIEMGANHQKEIESYCLYTLPTHGIITNCGKAHLEGFGGVEGVKKGKGELYAFLKQNNGFVFVMKDYDYLLEMCTGINQLFTYGTKDANITGMVKSNEKFLTVIITNGTTIHTIETNLVGDYNLPNVLVAVAVGKYFGVADAQIKLALENYLPSNSRSQLIEKGSNKIILDAYNANPTSMKAAIENFASMPDSEKILIIGGMKEMGEESYQEHAAILQLIHQYNWKSVVLVGAEFAEIEHPYLQFENSLEAQKWLSQQHFENSLLLVKGSRSMQMEKVIE